MKVPKIKNKKKVKESINNEEALDVKGKRKKKRKFSIKNGILIVLISSGIVVASLVLAFALYIIITSPDFIPEELYNKESTIIYAKDGTTEIARIGSSGREGENVELVTYNDLPQVIIDALVATEDSRFFQHNGFDAARFIKASLGQLAGQNVGGASTLSMQVIKNKFSNKETEGIRGIIRKFSDIYMAVFKLEAVYTKEEIIEFYLNSQWLGIGTSYYNGSITGVEQASQYFFGKSVSDLTLPEASLLVGMFNNPYVFNPYNNPEGASERRSVVLSLMVRHGYITEEEQKFAESVTVPSLLVDHSEDDTSKYQAFIDFVMEQVKDETGDDPWQVPMAIYSTLDTNIQDVLEQLEDGELYNFPDEYVQYGMAITSVKDGSILAISGGRNYQPQSLNRAVGPQYNGIKRQPGSTAKPIFDYGPHIEYLNSSPGTIFIDRPWSYSNGQSVRNYDYRYVGAITMREALVDSRNIPALQAFQQVANKVGADKISDFAHSLGIDYGDTLYESIAIGGVECANPLTMSAAYATFGRGGEYIEPYSFTKVVYLESEDEYPHQVERTRVMSEQTAYLITDMLVTGGSRYVGGSFTISGTQIAAKTGTTTIDGASAAQVGVGADCTPDSWNITYSPDYAIALWYGYDRLEAGKPYLNSYTGSVGRLSIMSAVATRVYEKNSTFSRPSGITSVTIESETYPVQLASEYTPSGLKSTQLYKSGYEPSEVSTRFAELENPTNGTSAFDGSTITISWDPIDTPDGINQSLIEEMYNKDEYWKFFQIYKKSYYESRLKYDKDNIGTVGYEVYLRNASGKLVNLGYTEKTTFTYKALPSISDYTFVVKSAYSKFKDNMSSGLTIKAQAQIDSNIPNTGGPGDLGDIDTSDDDVSNDLGDTP